MSKTTKNVEYNFTATDKNVSSTVDKLGSSFDKLGNKASESAKKMNTADTGARKVGKATKQAGSDVLYMNKSLSSLATQLYNANMKNDSMVKTMREVSGANRTAVSSLESLKSEYRTLAQNKDYDLEKTKKLVTSTNELGKALNTSKSNLASVEKTITKLTNTKRVLTEQIKRAETQFGKNSNEVKTLRAEYDRCCSTLGNMKSKHTEESAVLGRISQQYDTLKGKVSVFEQQAIKVNKSNEALKKLKSTNEALYNKELVLHNSIQKTNRQLQSKASMASKTTTEMSNYRKRIQEVSQQLAIEAQKQDASTMSLMKFDSKLRMVNSTVDTYEHKVKQLRIAQANLAQTIKEKEVAYKKLSTNMKENGVEAERLKTDIKELQATYDMLGNELKDSEAELKAMKSDARALASQLDASKKSVTSFSANVRTLGRNIQEASSKLVSAGKSVASFGNMVQQTGRGIIGVGNSLRWVTMLGTGVFGGAIKSGLEFDGAMADLASTIDTTELGVDGLSGAMGVLENRVRDLAKRTIYNPKEVAEGMKYLSLAGYSTSDMLSSIEPMLKMAQIGNMDLAQATDLLTDAMASYRMEVSDMPRFLDAMAKVQASSNTNIAQATEAYIWAGGTLADYNVSLEESASLIGILANQGLKGATAGRSLSSIMVNLTKESGESYKALEKLNKLTGKDVFAFNRDGSYKGVENQLKTLKEALYNSGLSEQDRNTIIQSIAGKNQMKTFTKLLAQINGEYDTLKTKVKNSEGELDRMHETVSQSSWAKFKEMLSAIQEVMLQIWEVIQPLVMFMVKKITELANKFISLNDKQKGNIVKWIAIATVIPMIIKSLGYFILMLGSVIKGFGWIIMAIGTFGKSLGQVIKGLGTFLGFLVKVWNTIKTFLGFFKNAKLFEALLLTFPKIASALETLIIRLMYLKDFFVMAFGFISKAVTGAYTVISGALASIAGAIGISVGWLIAIIVAVVGVIWWMVDAWKRGFDKTAEPIENIGNMFKEMGKDLEHFFVSIWNSIATLTWKLQGKTKEQIQDLKEKSMKDKEAIAEGYKDYSDKKTQEKQAKKNAKAQEKAQKESQKKVEKVDDKGLISKSGDVLKNGLGDLAGKFNLDIDDGGFFGEFANFMDGYEEFAKDFNGEKKEAKFEAKLDADISSIIEAETTLKTLEDEYSKMEVNVELAKDAVKLCNDNIQALITERRKLEIEPEANKKRLKEIDEQLDKFTTRREANLEIVAKGKEKLDQIKKTRDEIKDKTVTLTTEYKEIGKEEEFTKGLQGTKFTLEYGLELSHTEFVKEKGVVEKRLKSIPDEIGKLEKKLELDLDDETKNKVISDLTELKNEQIMLQFGLEYMNEVEILRYTSRIKEDIEKQMQDKKIEIEKLEWVSKQGIALSPAEQEKLKGLKQDLKDLKKDSEEWTKAQETAKKTIEGLGTDKYQKFLEYMEGSNDFAGKLEEHLCNVGDVSKETADNTQATSDNLETTADNAETVSDKISDTKDNIDDANKSLDDFTTEIDFLSEKDIDVNIDDTKDDIDDTTDSTKNLNAEIDDTKKAFEDLAKASKDTNVDKLTRGLENSKTFVEVIREKIISINNILGSTTYEAFSNAGKVLLEKLIEARTAVLNIAGVANNSGVNAMTKMGQALTNALTGARQRVLDVANVANNYGKNAMSSMGQALIDKLNSAKRIVSSIANVASGIRIPTPVPPSGGNSGGGQTRGLLQAQFNEGALSVASIGRALSNVSTSTNTTSNSNSFNFNIDRVVMDSKSDIKKTAKQFTIMCQREGVLK